MLLREYLQKKHGMARRTFTQYVDAGVVFVGDKKVDSYKQNIENDEWIMVHARHEIHEKVKIEKEETMLVMFNKPMGYVVSKADPHNQTIYELLPHEFKDFYYIGRLDKDSRGLLLLTNDPKIVNIYEHPRYGIEKEYLVEIDRVIDEIDKKKMLKGVMDEGEDLKIKTIKGNGTCVRVLLEEGKKRHIRRIFKVLGYGVLDLQRIREGEFLLGDLKEGQWKRVDFIS